MVTRMVCLLKLSLALLFLQVKIVLAQLICLVG